jgi:Protein of unknown function (DUF3443)
MAAARILKIGLCAVLCLGAIACGGGGGGASSASSSSSGGVSSSSSGSTSSSSSSGGTSSSSSSGGTSSSSSSGGTSSSSSSGGTSSSSGTTSNVASVIVDQGPSNQSVNTLFVSVTVCAPGSTTSCQTIDHIQVDSGSYGLRLVAPPLTLTLPVETLANGSSLAECTQFADGFSWGPVVTADIQIAGEQAHSVPVQVIGDSRFTSIPANCSSTGGTSEDTVSTFGANGILGIGPFELDCGDCTNNIRGLYYACTGSTCTDTTVPANMQVPNPVTHFAADNNGTIIVLPAVPDAGALTVSGSLIFGIDTQANNVSGTQTVLILDGNANLSISADGTTFASSFIDSGSNGVFFNDTTIAKCVAPPNEPTSTIVDFYCPGTPITLGVIIEGQNMVTTNNLTFTVGNAQTMLNANASFNAFPQLAGTFPMPGTFDYGLPFYYGKRVAMAVEGAITTAGTGPYVAF